MLTTYRRLLTLPGAASFTVAGFVTRMPISMIGLGCVLLITRSGGSYALAGAVAATVALVSSATTPTLARIADRHGQAGLIAGGLAVETAGILLLVGAVRWHAPGWLLLATAGLIGVGHVPVGTLVRVRWSHATVGTGLGHVAYSWEAVLDEVIFVAGPVLVTLLCTRVAPRAGLLAAAAIGVVGGCLLLPQRASEPPRSTARSRSAGPAIRHPVVRGVALVSFGLGGIFGSVEVAVVAIVTERGQAGLAGLVLAAFATGSMVAGLVHGALRPATRVARRLVWTTAGLTVALGTLQPLPNTAALAVVIFVAGLAVAPSLISSVTLIGSTVPEGARTEAMSWLSTGIGFGLAAGATVVGRVIDEYGARPAFWVPVVAGGFAVAAAAFTARRSPAPATGTAVSRG
ncbi:MAG: MFS transporter [Actinobacteria bacterium]|nr:MFS transporter [Actinomycetota bacterium]MBI3687782.1 MFS transporter [Actinomycetota bacterium]